MSKWSETAAKHMTHNMMTLMRMPVMKHDRLALHGEALALIFLREYPGSSPKQIAEFLKVSSARVAKMLSNLEAKGYVRRENSLNDRRMFKIYITEEGKYVVSRLNEKVWAHQSKILEKLGEEDAMELLRIFDRLLKIIEVTDIPDLDL